MLLRPGIPDRHCVLRVLVACRPSETRRRSETGIHEYLLPELWALAITLNAGFDMEWGHGF
jgi:hypothetical protein